MTSSGTWPRSPCSAAMSAAAWAASSALPWAGRPPSAVTAWWWMPLCAGGRIREVEQGVAGLVERGDGGAGGGGLAGADLARDHAESAQPR